MPNQDLFKAYQQGIKETQNTKDQKRVQSTWDSPLFSDTFHKFSEHYETLTALPRKIRRAMQKKWKHSLAGIALVLALGGTPALGNTIMVDDGEVTIAENNMCSIREAIINANDNALTHDDCAIGDDMTNGGDTIMLPIDSLFTLPDAPAAFDFSGTNGLPVITSTITIEGNGSTIQRDPNLDETTPFRIFAVDGDGNNGDLTLRETTVSGGFVVGFSEGGGIYNDNGIVEIINSTITNNEAQSNGGGIRNEGGGIDIINSTISENDATFRAGGIFNDDSSGTVTITGSTISSNTAGDEGGGIFNRSGATIIITNSIISGNSAEEEGGGAYIASGMATITNSTISDNIANEDGGGIYNDSSGILNIYDSTISGNTATDNGGGIYNDNGTATITNSTISGNEADNEGGGIYNEGGEVTITKSTISGNEADDGGGIFGSGELTVTNSTISGNMATGEFGAGGGLFKFSNTATITNSTISGNTATDLGGGIYNENGTVNIQNTIVSGNMATRSGDNCYGGGSINDNGNNLSDDATCGFSGDNDANINLGPLADNGGPTQTHALLNGSSAIDGGDNATCAADPVNGVDQRSFPRPSGPNCDIGAFEAQSFIKITKLTDPTMADTAFAFMLDGEDFTTMFELADGEMFSSALTEGDFQVTESKAEGYVVEEVECTDDSVEPIITIDNNSDPALIVDFTIIGTQELNCTVTNSLIRSGRPGPGAPEEEIEVDPGQDGAFAEISVSTGIPGGGTIFIALPDEVLALAASLVPNIAPCQILGGQTANVEDADVVCDIEDFPFDIDVILNLCRQGNVSGVAEAVVEVISEDRPEESTEETIEIALNGLELCQMTGDGDGDSEPGGDGDSSGDGDGAGSGCSVAPVNTTSTNSIIVTLLTAVAGIAGAFFRRRARD